MFFAERLSAVFALFVLFCLFAALFALCHSGQVCTRLDSSHRRIAEAGAVGSPSSVVFPLNPAVEGWVETIPVALRFWTYFQTWVCALNCSLYSSHAIL